MIVKQYPIRGQCDINKLVAYLNSKGIKKNSISGTTLDKRSNMMTDIIIQIRQEPEEDYSDIINNYTE